MDKALSPTQPTADWAGAWPLAVEAGDAARVESLLASGASVDATFDRGETALMRASARGYEDVARVLLAAGADVNARREDGFTPLILAVFFGHEDIVLLLLEAGADASARTALGTTAAKWAASRGFKEIVELLSEAEASRPAPPPEQRVSSVEQQDAPVEHPDSKARAVEHHDLKRRMEALVAAPSVLASREPDTAADDIRAGGSFIDDRAGEGATVESARAVEVTSATFAKPDELMSNEPASKKTAQGSAPSSGARFGSVLQSWPVTAGAVVLIVASVASVFLLRRGADPSGARPTATTTTGEAAQPVVPQTPPGAAENLPQPSPSVTPEVAQPLHAAPGTYDSFPFTPSPQEVIISGPPLTSGSTPASNVPSVVSESGGGREAGGEATRGRASDAETREATPTSAAPSRAAREGEGVDEGSSPETPPRGPQQRTGVETRRTAAQAPPPSPGNTQAPAPTPAERRKVIQWP